MRDKKNWTGNTHSTFVTLGASNHVEHEREENDYYATEPLAAELLLDFFQPRAESIWEPACGEGHLVNVFREKGYNVLATDLIDRGCVDEVVDFLKYDTNELLDMDIITNPPYKYAKEFVLKSLDIIKPGNHVVMFLKIQFLEAVKRRDEIFNKYPPKYVYVSSHRLRCAMNGKFTEINEKTGKEKPISSASCYAWYIWEKGFQGEPTLRWFN
jgi:hypothetical protein